MQFRHQNVINYGSMFGGKAGHNGFSGVDCNELFPRASLDVTWKPVTPSGNIHAPKSHFGHSQISDFDFDDIFESNLFSISKRKVVTLDRDVFVGNFDVFVLEKEYLFAHLVLWFLKNINSGIHCNLKWKRFREDVQEISFWERNQKLSKCRYFLSYRILKSTPKMSKK